jgi:hypothetical protein
LSTTAGQRNAAAYGMARRWLPPLWRRGRDYGRRSVGSGVFGILKIYMPGMSAALFEVASAGSRLPASPPTMCRAARLSQMKSQRHDAPTT